MSIKREGEGKEEREREKVRERERREGGSEGERDPLTVYGLLYFSLTRERTLVPGQKPEEKSQTR